LYIPDGRREAGPSPLADPGNSAEIQNAQRLEFQEKDYPKALAAYRKTLQHANDPRLAGMILNFIARAQRKSGLLQEAVSTYESIVLEHGGAIIPGGIPLGPSAALEICGLSRKLKDYTKCLQASVGLYRSLLLPEWNLEKTDLGLLWIRFLSASPDGRSLAFQASGKNLRQREVWVMENFLPADKVKK
jgi:tetratricopeptide (TPR) repeat protein